MATTASITVDVASRHGSLISLARPVRKSMSSSELFSAVWPRPMSGSSAACQCFLDAPAPPS